MNFYLLLFNLLNDMIDYAAEINIGFHIPLNLIARMDDRRMIPFAKFSTNFRKRPFGERSTEIHRDLSWLYDAFRPFLAA